MKNGDHLHLHVFSMIMLPIAIAEHSWKPFLLPCMQGYEVESYQHDHQWLIVIAIVAHEIVKVTLQDESSFPGTRIHHALTGFIVLTVPVQSSLP